MVELPEDLGFLKRFLLLFFFGRSDVYFFKNKRFGLIFDFDLVNSAVGAFAEFGNDSVVARDLVLLVKFLNGGRSHFGFTSAAFHLLNF